MKLNIIVFTTLNQKVLYIKEVNYYFEINNVTKLEVGSYLFTQKELLDFLFQYKPTLYNSIKRLIKDYSVKQFEKEKYRKEALGIECTLCLHPSRTCNLGCKYCFGDDQSLDDKNISIETAKNAIDFLIYKYSKNASQYIIDLSGSGEPLLKFELIKEVVSYCDEKRNETGKNVVVMFATNATKLTPEIIDFIDNSSLIVIGASIDGQKELNDRNRVYKDNLGTYNDIIKGINSFRFKKPGLAVTITPTNQEVDEIYDHLYHIDNADCVSMRLLRSFDESEYDFENIDIDYLMTRYDLLCNNVLRELQKDNIDYLYKLIQGSDQFGSYIRSNLLKGVVNNFRCDAGKQRIAVNSNGDIYACSVMMGNKDFWMGNIDTGLISDNKWDFWEPSVTKSLECRECWASKVCGGECYAVGYMKNNNPNKPYDKKCTIKQGLIKRSMALLEIIKSQYPNMFNKLVDFSFNINQYSQTDTAIWSIIKTLEFYGFSPKYSDVIKKIKITQQGVHPNDLLKYISKFIKGIDAFQIDNIESYKEISYPAISLLNKKKNLKYNYLILMGQDENNDLILYSIHDMNYMIISSSEFHSFSSDIVITVPK